MTTKWQDMVDSGSRANGPGKGQTVAGRGPGGPMSRHLIYATDLLIHYAAAQGWRSPIRVLLLAACRLTRRRLKKAGGDDFMTRAWSAHADVLRWEDREQA